MKRVISLWLVNFATDRLSRRLNAKERSSPLVTVTAVHGALRVAAANDAARRAGISPGFPLADARALVRGLKARQDDPGGNSRTLVKLAEKCGLYSPWTAVDPSGGGGLWLDISGCAHLFGGEQALLDDLIRRMKRAGFQARAGCAATPGAAWALARFATTAARPAASARPGDLRTTLAPLPVAALRLAPDLGENLDRVGLRRIGDLLALPRAPLASRFGETLARRLDQALGRTEEPISPLRPPPRHHSRLVFADPIGRTEDIARGLESLLAGLTVELAKTREGVRRLELVLYRVDGSRVRALIGTSRPTRDAKHLARLFTDKIAAMDVGFGVEAMVLAATAADPLDAAQMNFDARIAGPGPAGEQAGGEETARLIDRLAGRLGAGNVNHLEPRASHIPERAAHESPAMTGASGGRWREAGGRISPRPLQLLVSPTPIEVMAPVPDGPPVMFRWRRRQHRVALAEGPERIAPEWWRREGCPLSPEVRDYYRIEDADGRRYWVYREGLYRPDRPPAWYLHGFFA